MTLRQAFGWTLVIAVLVSLAVFGSVASDIWWIGPAGILGGIAMVGVGMLIAHLLE